MLHSLSCAEAREHSLPYLSKLGTQISHLCFQTAFLIQDSIEFCLTSMEENFQILDTTLSHRQICIFLLVAGKTKVHMSAHPSWACPGYSHRYFVTRHLLSSPAHHYMVLAVPCKGCFSGSTGLEHPQNVQLVPCSVNAWHSKKKVMDRQGKNKKATLAAKRW